MKSIYFVWVILSRNYKSKLKTQMDSFQYPVQVSFEFKTEKIKLYYEESTLNSKFTENKDSSGQSILSI